MKERKEGRKEERERKGKEGRKKERADFSVSFLPHSFMEETDKAGRNWSRQEKILFPLTILRPR